MNIHKWRLETEEGLRFEIFGIEGKNIFGYCEARNINLIGMEVIDFISENFYQDWIEKHKITVIKDLGKDGSFMFIKKSKEGKIPSWESSDYWDLYTIDSEEVFVRKHGENGEIFCGFVFFQFIFNHLKKNLFSSSDIIQSIMDECDFHGL